MAEDLKIPIARGILFQKEQDFRNLFGDFDFKVTDGMVN